MNNLKINLIFSFIIVFLIYPVYVLSVENITVIGSCEDLTKKIEIGQTFYVIHQNAEIYESVTCTNYIYKVKFGEYAEVRELRDKHNRILISKPGAETPLGWIEKKNLLYTVIPLKNRENIERKVFIKTLPSNKKNNPLVATSFSRDMKDKRDKLSRFMNLFVYAEDIVNNTFLVSFDYNIEMSPDRLVGWVKKSDCIPWDTRRALRPNGTYLDKEMDTDEDVLNIYSSNISNCSKQCVSDEIDDKKIIVVGNKKHLWYKTELNIPIIDTNCFYNGRKYYKVAAPGLGVTEDILDNDIYSKIQKFEFLSHVDIFFLIDGTNSTSFWIPEVKKLVKHIANKFVDHPNYNGTSFRFGYRIYRDTYADNILNCKKGVCEGLALTKTNCNTFLSKDQIKKNLLNFERNINVFKKEKIEEEKYDSYPESLFNGLIQVVSDINNCPDHVKIVYVIGDCRDNLVEVPSWLPKMLKNIENLALRFIQIPMQNNKENYIEAYNKFETQALDILKEIYSKKRFTYPFDYKKDFFKTLTVTDLKYMKNFNDLILNFVKIYSKSSEVHNLRKKILMGGSVKEYIEQKMIHGDLPILYLNWIAKKKHEIGNQWEERVDHRVIEAYIPESDVKKFWTKVIFIPRRELIDNKNFLNEIGKVGDNFSKKRNQLINTIRLTLQNILGKPALKDTGQTMEQYIQERGKSLTVREGSPFLQYELIEIKNAKACEILRLQHYIKNTAAFLNKIYYNPTRWVQFKRAEYPDSQCNGVSEKGKKIMRIINVNNDKILAPENALEPKKYSYRKTLGGEIGFWIPMEFLP